ncbi:hypothetical protein ACFL4Z_03260 [candidate division KSB1 bacterium]
MNDNLKDLSIRCRQLGHDVPLSYCLKMNVKLPCPEIINCWEQKIKISEFIAKNYTKDKIERIFSVVQKSKIEKLIEIINKFKK